MIESLHAVPTEALLAELRRRREVLAEEIEASTATPRHTATLDAVASAWGLRRADLFAPTRRQPIAEARQAAMAALSAAGCTQVEISGLFRCDRGTVLWAINKHSIRMESNDRQSRDYASRFLTASENGISEPPAGE